jgi:hypothetical protein
VGAVLSLFSAALTAVVILAGCGESDEPAISKAEFIEQASAVCAKTSSRIETEFAAYGESREAREVERARRANELTAEKANKAAARVGEEILIPAIRRQLAELRELGVPREDGGGTEELLAAFDEGIEKAEARPERAARDGTEAFGKSRRLAEEYGIDNC